MKYSPHKYQTYATNFILEHPISAVFLDMGLGKSVITLTAIFDLCLDSFLVRKVLVIAPLRVALDTWPSEIEKWDHLRGLIYSVKKSLPAKDICLIPQFMKWMFTPVIIPLNLTQNILMFMRILFSARLL